MYVWLCMHSASLRHLLIYVNIMFVIIFINPLLFPISYRLDKRICSIKDKNRIWLFSYGKWIPWTKFDTEIKSESKFKSNQSSYRIIMQEERTETHRNKRTLTLISYYKIDKNHIKSKRRTAAAARSGKWFWNFSCAAERRSIKIRTKVKIEFEYLNCWFFAFIFEFEEWKNTDVA